MRVQTNLAAYSTQGKLAINSGKKSKTIEKLSSGQRLNRSADDAAGISISEKMRAQIRGMNRASANVQDGISLLDVADGALQKCHDIVVRMRELAVQSGSDTNENVLDRNALDLEYQELKKELNDIVDNTHFNGIKLLDGSIARLSLVGIDLDITGQHAYATQDEVNSIVYGVSTVDIDDPIPKAGSTVTMPTPTGSVVTTDGVVSTQNGTSLYDAVFDSSDADIQGRNNAGLSVIEASDDLTVYNNSYSGYVKSTGSHDSLEVLSNSGFVHSNADNTTISNNDHTGQVLIDGGSTASISNNVGGEIQVGTIGKLTITSNDNFSGYNSNTYDYTGYAIIHYEDGTTRQISITEYPVGESQMNDRVKTDLSPQYDGNGFSDKIKGTLQSDGITYKYESNSFGKDANNNDKAFNNITYYYRLNNKTEYSGPLTSGSEYNYAYNTYWDEYQEGKLTSDALVNEVGSNSGYIDLTNTSAGSKADINSNSGNIYVSNKEVTVNSNGGPVVADSNVDKLVVTTNSYWGTTKSPQYDNYLQDGHHTHSTYTTVGIVSSANDTKITTNKGTALITRGDLTVGTNTGFLEVRGGVVVKDIGDDSTGTVVLEAGANVTSWMANSIDNKGTIELHGATTPNPFVANSNTGTIKITGGGEVNVTNNTGRLEIDGTAFGGTAGNIASINNNNGGPIKNAGTLKLSGDNAGTVNNYGIVDVSGLNKSVPLINHFAMNLNTSGVAFPPGLDYSSNDLQTIAAQLDAYEYEIKFTANGVDYTASAKWQLKADADSANCTCDPSVDVCQSTYGVSLDAFELVFDFSDPNMKISPKIDPSDYDFGHIVVSEDESLRSTGLLYELEGLVSGTGETGNVGTKLVFNAGLAGTQTAQYENNDGLIIQSGANYNETTAIYIEKFSTLDPNDGGCLSCPCGTLSPTDIRTLETARNAIGICDKTTNRISTVRAGIGAMHNRLEYKDKNLNLSSEYLQSAESLVRDSDMAKEATALIRQDILTQSSTAMLSLSNNLPQAVLQLLG